MFGNNNPYDLVAPGMLAELRRNLAPESDEPKPEKSQQAEGAGLPQRIIAALTSRQPSLKLASASSEGDCSEA